MIRNPNENLHDLENIESRTESLRTGFERLTIKSNRNTKTAQNQQQFITNYVKIDVGNNTVFKHSVVFRPQVDSNGLKCKLLSQHENIIGDKRSFDGTTLYTPTPVCENTLFLKSFSDDTCFEICIKFLEEYPLSECHSLIALIFKRVLRHAKLKKVGRGYFNPDLKIDIKKHSISLWPGYNTSVVRSDDGQFLWNLDSSFKLFRKDCALDVMGDIYFKAKDFQRECINIFVGQTVITPYNNKTYRVDDIAWDKSPKDSFEYKNGKQITYIDYYKLQYGLDVKDSDQPLFVNVSKANDQKSLNIGSVTSHQPLIFLVPEFCFLTGLTDDLRNDYNAMREFSQYITPSPSQRLTGINKLVLFIKSDKNAMHELNSWGLGLSNSPLKITGISLIDEQVYGRNPNEPINTKKKSDWSNSLRNLKPLTTPPLDNWICVYPSRESRRIEKFITCLEEAVRNSTLKFQPPTMVPLNNDTNEAFLKHIEHHLSSGERLNFVLCVFPTQRHDRYSLFKRLVCCKYPIPSQGLLINTISKESRLPLIANRVALQMNCKLGGSLWRVNIPMKSIMVIGIDVYHCNLNKSRSSVVGFVSSIDDQITKWFSRVSFQAQSTEMIVSLRAFVRQAIKTYFDANQQLPQKIIIFRDGVSESQINYVTDLEINPLIDTLRTFYDGYEPEVAFIVVRKRINTRYFSTDASGNVANPAPGSIIEDVVTTSSCPNFYLVSQNFNVGTVLPINLVILHNSTTLSMERIQRFCYKCTYLYYNWSGTVKVPAPCQYAHKVAYLSGQYLHEEADLSLVDKLYYL